MNLFSRLKVHARLFVLAFLVLLATAACRPKLPPVSGCTPLSHRCEADSPEVCSPSQRWHRVGDLACAEVRAVCVVTDGGVAACAPMRDGSAPDTTAAQVELELSVTSPLVTDAEVPE